MRDALNIIVRIVGPLLVLAVIPFSPGGTSTTQAGSGPIIVDTTADGGGGSFRQALDTAAGTPGSDIIQFDPSVFPPGNPATIDANANYLIEGDGALQPLTIDATNAGVIFDFTGVVEGDAAFHWSPDGPLTGITLRNFTIQNFVPDINHAGHGVEFGGGITSATDVLFDNMRILNNAENGLFLNAEDVMTNVAIQDSTISGNGSSGIQIGASSFTNLVIQDNDISANMGGGIDINTFDPGVASSGQITQNGLEENNGDAIFIAGQESATTTSVRISQNSTTNNSGLGINLLGFGNEFDGITENDTGDGDLGANDLLNFPVLSGAGPTGITGTACANCTIEVFIADGDPTSHGEGATYLGTGSADALGSFSVEACANEGANVTATATDAAGNTSEFALNYILPAASCRSIRLHGDSDCDGDVTSRDNQALLREVLQQNPLSQTEPCPDLGENAGGRIWGDWDCDGGISSRDNQALLRAVLQQNPLSQTEPCPDIGAAA